MPTISMFYGILIRMYYEDHNPPPLSVLIVCLCSLLYLLYYIVPDISRRNIKQLCTRYIV